MTKKSRKFPPNEHNTIVREVIEVACQKTGATRKALMVALVPYGVNYSTTHGVFYSVIRGSQSFTDQLVEAIGRLQESYSPANDIDQRVVALRNRDRKMSAELREMRKIVERMCIACAAPDKGETPRCWDGTCPLRAISPLPLAKGA
jgi:hypothetical protein